MALVAGVAGAADNGTTPRTFVGRTGATAVKVVVVCGIPDPDSPGGLIRGLAARIKETSGAGPRPDVGALLKLADQWSGDRPVKSAKDVEDLLKTVPPKYHAMIRDYFAQLERMSNEKK